MSWAVATAHQASRSPATKLNRRVVPIDLILRTPSFLMTLIVSLRFGSEYETVTFDRRELCVPHGSSCCLKTCTNDRAACASDLHIKRPCTKSGIYNCLKSSLRSLVSL